MKLARVGLLFALVAFAPGFATATTVVSEVALPSEVVVLVHGLYRSERSMRPLEAPIQDAGFRVVNLAYDSRSQTPHAFVAEFERQIRACCVDAPKLHFVTHSLGGIVTRAYVAAHRPANLGRVVMLAPPNHGSPLADIVASSTLLRFFLGTTAAQLGTDPASFPNSLPPADDYELGVIAGTGNLNPLRAAFIDGDSDGTVPVSSTRLDGMRDFITVPASHTFIMRSDEVRAQTLRFLTSGRFAHVEP